MAEEREDPPRQLLAARGSTRRLLTPKKCPARVCAVLTSQSVEDIVHIPQRIKVWRDEGWAALRRVVVTLCVKR